MSNSRCSDPFGSSNNVDIPPLTASHHHQALPLFTDSGTTLDAQQQVERARKKGLCINCGLKTHSVLPYRRTPLTNTDVYQGHCIKCEPEEIPSRILKEWQERNPHLVAVTPTIHRTVSRGSAQPIKSRHSSNSMRHSTSGHGGHVRLGSMGDGSGAHRNSSSHSVGHGSHGSSSHKSRSPPHMSSSRSRASADPRLLSASSSRIPRHQRNPSSSQNSPLPRTTLEDKEILVAPDFSNFVSEMEDPDELSASYALYEDGGGNTSQEPEYQIPASGNHSVSLSTVYSSVSARTSRTALMDDQSCSYMNPHYSTCSIDGTEEGEEEEQDDMDMLRMSQINLTAVPDDLVDKAETDCVVWLGNMATKSPDAVESGEVSATMNMMKKYSPNVSIQQYACQAIYGLLHAAASSTSTTTTTTTQDDPIRQQILISLLVQTDAVELLLNAMQQHMDLLPILHPCISALVKLSHYSMAVQAMSQRKEQLYATLMEAMKCHLSDPTFISLACQWIHQLLSKDKSIKARILSSSSSQQDVNEIVSLVVSISKEHLQSSDVVPQATAVLYQFSRSHKGVGNVPGICPTVIQVMNVHLAIAQVQSNGAGILKNLCVNESAIQTIASEGGIAVLLAAMTAHPASDTLQYHACGALKHLSFAEANEIAIAKQGGIAAVLEAMKRHGQDVNLQQEAFAALRNLFVSEKNKRAIAKKHEDIIVMMERMQEHLANAQLQQKACGALRNLSVHSEFQKPIIKAGGIATTLSVMDHHADDDKIQTLGCGVLRSLAANISSKSPLDFGEKGVQVVLRAMQDHRIRSAKLGLQAIGFLRTAAKHGDYRLWIARNNGIHVIIEAMDLFQSDVALQREACEALLNLSIDKANSTAIGKEGGISAILESMEYHCKDANLQSSGCGVLWNLSMSPDNFRLVVQERADLAVIGGMKLHEQVCAVQKKGCLALSSLAAIDECRAFLCEGETMQVVITAIQCHDKDAQVQKYAFKFLGTMLTSSDSKKVYKSAIAKHESALRQAMKLHSDNADLQKYCCKIFPS